MLDKFGLKDTNPVSTPMDPDVKLDYKPEEEEEPETNDATYSYSTLIGSLMYLAISTRPDISFAVNRLAQFTRNPKPRHWTAVKRVFRYLKGTRTHGICYGGPYGDDEGINFYSDADWASSADRKSISGHVVTIAGGAVAWGAKKQNNVALSTAEAEYLAAVQTAKQVIWFSSLFSELSYSMPDTPTIFCDNQAAISISHHPEHHSKTKHIDIACHFLRDMVQKKKIQLKYISTKENIADIFTKGLSRSGHEDLTTKMGVVAG